MENNKLSNIFKLQILVVLAIAVTLSLGFYMNKDATVTLHIDQNVEEIVTRASTVEEFLQEQEIKLDKKGYINVSLEKAIEDNMDIMIRRPKTYTLSLAGAEWKTTSIYSTVEEVLTDSGVNFDEGDFAIPDLKSQVPNGHKISLFRVHEETNIVKEKIAFEEIVNKNPKLEVGTVNIVQEGKEGVKEVETLSRFINGSLARKELVEERVITEPVNRIVERGTKDKVKTSRGDTSYRKVMTMSATAYDLSYASCGKNPGDRGYGITASGTKARPGAVAVDPRVIPLGTKLYIESLDGTADYGFATAEDTGGAIKGKKIDLFFHSATDVRNFGRRNVKVYILK